jgi:hypothetical protein
MFITTGRRIDEEGQLQYTVRISFSAEAAQEDVAELQAAGYETLTREEKGEEHVR